MNKKENRTMSAHTPGPWSYAELANKRSDGYIRAESVRQFEGAEKPIAIAKVCTVAPRDQVRANTRLIAAAPDLLAACQDAEEFLRPMDEQECSGFTGADLDAIMATLRAAIAKATGK